MPPPFTAPEYVIGDPKAPVTVIEYLSDTCSHCARFDAQVWPKIKARFVDTGKVKWVVREFLTGPVEVSAAGFVLARCAGRDHYFEVIEQIFRAQPQMEAANDWRGPFLKIAQGVGLNEEQVKACLSDDAPYKALDARVDRAVKVDKIDGTPTLLINGKKAFDGVPTVEELDKALVAAGAR